MMRLRPFNPSDISDILKITSSSMPERYPSSMFLGLHDFWREGFIVCDYFGTTVGFVVGTTSGPKTGRILVIAVLGSHRSRGIGSALIREFTNACAMKGLNNIELEVRVSNKEAVRFYTKHGYQITGVIQKFYKDGEDGYKMWRSL